VQPVLLPLDLGQRLVPYAEGWDLQERLHAQVVSGDTVPTILLLEHDHIYTAGTRTQPPDLPPADEPVVQVNRGGRITWHGPGQIVAYPIVPLPNPVDVVAFVRSLEAALIATCADLGLDTVRIPGRSGVWVTGPIGDEGSPPAPDRKVAAIGVRVAKGVAMHGVALNVDCDLAAFGAIVPCGIADAGVTSLAAEGIPLPARQPVVEVGTLLGAHLRDQLSWD
jgi:lipoyl(octanoyl) transferase